MATPRDSGEPAHALASPRAQSAEHHAPQPTRPTHTPPTWVRQGFGLPAKGLVQLWVLATLIGRASAQGGGSSYGSGGGSSSSSGYSSSSSSSSGYSTYSSSSGNGGDVDWGPAEHWEIVGWVVLGIVGALVVGISAACALCCVRERRRERRRQALIQRRRARTARPRSNREAGSSSSLGSSSSSSSSNNHRRMPPLPRNKPRDQQLRHALLGSQHMDGFAIGKADVRAASARDIERIGTETRKWDGVYQEYHSLHPTAPRLAVSHSKRAKASKFRLSGSGHDAGDKPRDGGEDFTIKGDINVDNQTLTFTKEYPRHKIRYEGTIGVAQVHEVGDLLIARGTYKVVKGYDTKHCDQFYLEIPLQGSGKPSSDSESSDSSRSAHPPHGSYSYSYYSDSLTGSGASPRPSRERARLRSGSDSGSASASGWGSASSSGALALSSGTLPTSCMSTTTSGRRSHS